MELMFSGSTQIEQLCQIISTSDDSVVENGEMFTLSLTSSESLITIPISSVTVHITDDDGKCNRRYLFDKKISKVFLLCFQILIHVFLLQMLYYNLHKKSMKSVRVLKLFKCVL